MAGPKKAGRSVLRSAIAVASESEARDANDRVQELQRELFIEALRASLRYQRHLIEVNISARRELGLPLDESQYREANREAEQRIANAIEEAVRELEQLQRHPGAAHDGETVNLPPVSPP
jgi:hypothetical protein